LLGNPKELSKPSLHRHWRGGKWRSLGNRPVAAPHHFLGDSLIDLRLAGLLVATDELFKHLDCGAAWTKVQRLLNGPRAGTDGRDVIQRACGGPAPCSVQNGLLSLRHLSFMGEQTENALGAFRSPQLRKPVPIPIAVTLENPSKGRAIICGCSDDPLNFRADPLGQAKRGAGRPD
jgi:hypothetical protein